MEEGIVELSLKGPIGIWQVKKVGNGEEEFSTGYPEVQRERILERSPHVRVCLLLAE